MPEVVPAHAYAFTVGHSNLVDFVYPAKYCGPYSSFHLYKIGCPYTTSSRAGYRSSSASVR